MERRFGKGPLARTARKAGAAWGIPSLAVWTGLALWITWSVSPAVGSAQPGVPRVDETTRPARVQAAVRAHVGVDQRVDQAVPLDATFVDERGNAVQLGDFFDGERPVVLNFAYYSCPVVCDLVLREMVTGLAEIGWTAGEEYEVVSISIDPRDGPAAARETKATLLEQYGRPSSGGFHLLTGDGEDAKRVAEAVGWKYDYLPVQEEYAHPAALVLLTPEGRIARYLLGLRYEPNDLRVGLLEASEGRSMTVVEQALVYCYRYDPESGGYVVVAERVMQVGGGLVAVSLMAVLGLLWSREIRRRRRMQDSEPKADDQTLEHEAVRT